jgi:hypothetical protein
VCSPAVECDGDGRNQRGQWRSAMGTGSGFMRWRHSGASPATGRSVMASARHKEAHGRVVFVWRRFVRGKTAMSRGGAWLHGVGGWVVTAHIVGQRDGAARAHEGGGGALNRAEGTGLPWHGS